MRIVIISLGVVIIAGLLAVAVQHEYSGTKTASSPVPAPKRQTARAPVAAALPSLSKTASGDLEPAQATSPAGGAAEKGREIVALYETARKISSAVERDKEYANLVGYAAGAGDFELAIEIADSISAVGERDNGYAKIVHQAMTVGDLGAADKAAEKISSVILRDEQFEKIAASCPSNTTTAGTAAVLGLENGK